MSVFDANRRNEDFDTEEINFEYGDYLGDSDIENQIYNQFYDEDENYKNIGVGKKSDCRKPLTSVLSNVFLFLRGACLLSLMLVSGLFIMKNTKPQEPLNQKNHLQTNIEALKMSESDYSDYVKNSGYINGKSRIFEDTFLTQFCVYYKKNLEKLSEDIAFVGEEVIENEKILYFSKNISIHICFDPKNENIKNISLVIPCNKESHEQSNKDIKLLLDSMKKTFNLKKNLDRNDGNYLETEHLYSEIVDLMQYKYFNYKDSDVFIVEISNFH